MDDTERILLREFLTHDGIKNYDSSVCWGCGEDKTDPCTPDCLLERTRKVLDNPLASELVTDLDHAHAR